MPKTVEEIMAHADELADKFESDDFEVTGVYSPAEFELLQEVRLP